MQSAKMIMMATVTECFDNDYVRVNNDNDKDINSNTDKRLLRLRLGLCEARLDSRVIKTMLLKQNPLKNICITRHFSAKTEKTKALVMLFLGQSSQYVGTKKFVMHLWSRDITDSSFLRKHKTTCYK